ncbi:MAG: tetratricopeptide repeat protein [Bacteroidota bacterium]
MKEEITQELFETIEKYLFGEMDTVAKADFENQIAADILLAEKVEEFKILFAGAEAAVLKGKMDEFHAEMVPTSSEARIRTMPVLRYMVAASVALLIALGGWWMFSQNDPNEQLFTQFFEPDPGLPTTMGINEAYEFNRGMVDYKSENYEAAILKWTPLQKVHPANDTLGFFMGVSLLATGDVEKAIPFLQTVIDKENSTFRNDALWYQGLSYLRQDNIVEARRLIEASNHREKDALLSNLK